MVTLRKWKYSAFCLVATTNETVEAGSEISTYSVHVFWQSAIQNLVMMRNCGYIKKICSSTNLMKEIKNNSNKCVGLQIYAIWKGFYALLGNPCNMPSWIDILSGIFPSGSSYLILWRPNITISTPFSNSLNLSFPFNVTKTKSNGH